MVLNARCFYALSGLLLSSDDLRRYFAYISRQLAKNLTWGTDDCALPMTPPRLVALIRHAMPEDGIVCLDNGLYKVGQVACKVAGLTPAKPSWQAFVCFSHSKVNTHSHLYSHRLPRMASGSHCIWLQVTFHFGPATKGIPAIRIFRDMA